MSELRLPALDGRSPLGFLAAVGLTRLLSVFTSQEPKLAWGSDDLAARLTTSFGTIDEVVDAVTAVIGAIPEGSLLPGVPAGFPPAGAAPDRLRLPPADLRNFLQTVAPDADDETEAWVTTLVTDLSLDDKGRSDISQFTAPSGKQSMHTMLDKPLQFLRRRPEVLHEALVGWRRYPGVTGEYLDHRVLFDAADSGRGESQERGVPGATWLALMAYPLMRTTASNGEPISSGWYRRPRRPPQFVYPLWSGALDPFCISVLIEHPRLRRWHQRQLQGGLPAEARVLGIFETVGSVRRRIPGRTFAGVLSPGPS